MEVDASAESSAQGGSVEITAPTVTVEDGAAISVTTFGSAAGGNITINADRNAVKPAVISKISGGKALYITTIRP